MAAGPGVSMQCGSPARELSLSVQQVANQTHGDRTKPEEATGKNAIMLQFCVQTMVCFANQANGG